MMEFIMMTVSFTVAILLAGVIACAVMLHPKVVNWYMKYVFKMMSQCESAFVEVYDELGSK